MPLLTFCVLLACKGVRKRLIKGSPKTVQQLVKSPSTSRVCAKRLQWSNQKLLAAATIAVESGSATNQAARKRGVSPAFDSKRSTKWQGTAW